MLKVTFIFIFIMSRAHPGNVCGDVEASYTKKHQSSQLSYANVFIESPDLHLGSYLLNPQNTHHNKKALLLFLNQNM